MEKKNPESTYDQHKSYLFGDSPRQEKTCVNLGNLDAGGTIRENLGYAFYKRSEFWGRITLGLIFTLASLSKIIHPAAFADAIHNYQILPDALVNITGIVLPWLELTLGILLITGIWLPGTILASTALLIVFWGSLLLNLVRGLDVHCGCFTLSNEGKPDMPWYILRDAGFLLLGLYLFVKIMFKPAVERS